VSTVQQRKLGQSPLEVPAVVFGAWAIGGWNWGGADEDLAVRAIQAAIDAGSTAIDTAPVYGFGLSERIVGRAIQGRRERVVVMSKVGLRWDDAAGDLYFETVDQDGVKRAVHRNARPESVKVEVEASLARMKVDVIDLIQLHWPDPGTPIEDTMSALLELKKAGKVRAIGVSNHTTAMMEAAQRALGDVPLASDQPKYSLLVRDIEKDILPFCRARNIGVIVYSPLEQGLLTGKVPAERAFAQSDGRHKRPTFAAQNRALVNDVLHRVVQPIADQHRATLGQIAIAWTIAQPGITSAIVGARTPEQAVENAKAGDIVLSAGELSAIRTAFEGLVLETPAKQVEKGLKSFVKRILGR
jgi:aryl-alcohol dehydrogenase-like predicted oxidoreductase